ncbi:MAG: hypothetical protein M1358_10615 [Chloroflexi bacterium]|nr:hypothetical protein [Chloroflexota bacterium]
MDERFIKDIVLGTVNKCGSCGHIYESENVTVVAHEEGLWLLMMNCPACSSRGLIAALVKDQAKAGSALEAQQAPEKEMQETKKLDVVSADDVLDIHEFLREFDGDFISLFDKQQ